MELDLRVQVFIAVILVALFGIIVLDLPPWILPIVSSIGVSYLLSGLFYSVLIGAGLDPLEDIKFGPLTALAILVFLLKLILL